MVSLPGNTMLFWSAKQSPTNLNAALLPALQEKKKFPNIGLKVTKYRPWWGNGPKWDL
jgi:hypothetical protein